MAARGIEVGPATYAFHRLGSFAGSSPRGDASGVRSPVGLPAADALHDRSLALPLYIGMRSTEIDRVCAALGEVVQ